MDLLVIVLILFLFLSLGAGPWWPWAGAWGYGPFGLLGFIFCVLLLVWLIRGTTGGRGPRI